jgi:hypothetical protein
MKVKIYIAVIIITASCALLLSEKANAAGSTGYETVLYTYLSCHSNLGGPCGIVNCPQYPVPCYQYYPGFGGVFIQADAGQAETVKLNSADIEKKYQSWDNCALKVQYQKNGNWVSVYNSSAHGGGSQIPSSFMTQNQTELDFGFLLKTSDDVKKILDNYYSGKSTQEQSDHKSQNCPIPISHEEYNKLLVGGFCNIPAKQALAYLVCKNPSTQTSSLPNFPNPPYVPPIQHPAVSTSSGQLPTSSQNAINKIRPAGPNNLSGSYNYMNNYLQNMGVGKPDLSIASGNHVNNSSGGWISMDNILSGANTANASGHAYVASVYDHAHGTYNVIAIVGTSSAGNPYVVDPISGNMTQATVVNQNGVTSLNVNGYTYSAANSAWDFPTTVQSTSCKGTKC